MGNNIRRVGLLSSVGVGSDEPFHVQLGRHVAIDLSRRKVNVKRSGKWSEKWTMSYTVDVSTCKLNLTRRSVEGGETKGLLIELHSESSEKNGEISEFDCRLDVQTVTESNVLANPHCEFIVGSTSFVNQSKKTHAGGSVTETEYCLYVVGDKGGLTVLERKKNIGDEQPYAVTLAHYFVTTSATNVFTQAKTDIGLSAVAKIRASNGNLDITVEGPDQHPAFGLRYLFDEVKRTEIWKPTMLPSLCKYQEAAWLNVLAV